MATLELEIVSALQDNYVYLLHDAASGATAAIDPSTPEPVQERLAQKGWKLTHIFTTHHHHDHTGGNVPLKRKTGCMVVGFSGDAARIPVLDYPVGDEGIFTFGEVGVRVLHVPGHTSGAITYYLPSEQLAFTGDTMFTMGCGRLLEGTAEQLFHSLKRLTLALPKETRIYSGHEYAHGNARFALTVEPGNAALQARFQHVADLMDSHTPVQGFALAEELATNPFLRTQSLEIRKTLGLESASDEEIFAELRRRKDAF